MRLSVVRIGEGEHDDSSLINKPSALMAKRYLSVFLLQPSLLVSPRSYHQRISISILPDLPARIALRMGRKGYQRQR